MDTPIKVYYAGKMNNENLIRIEIKEISKVSKDIIEDLKESEFTNAILEDGCKNEDGTFTTGPMIISGIHKNKHTCALCLLQIENADIVITEFDNKLTCFGTFSEIGYAYGLNIPIYILTLNDALKEAWFTIDMIKLSMSFRNNEFHERIFQTVGILKDKFPGGYAEYTRKLEEFSVKKITQQ